MQNGLIRLLCECQPIFTGWVTCGHRSLYNPTQILRPLSYCQNPRASGIYEQVLLYQKRIKKKALKQTNTFPPKTPQNITLSESTQILKHTPFAQKSTVPPI